MGIRKELRDLIRNGENFWIIFLFVFFFQFARRFKIKELKVNLIDILLYF